MPAPPQRRLVRNRLEPESTTERRHSCIESSRLIFCQASFSARSFVAEFRKPSLDFIGIRLRERLNTELNE
jgi:hypothetical protein